MIGQQQTFEEHGKNPFFVVISENLWYSLAYNYIVLISESTFTWHSCVHLFLCVFSTFYKDLVMAGLSCWFRW